MSKIKVSEEGLDILGRNGKRKLTTALRRKEAFNKAEQRKKSKKSGFGLYYVKDTVYADGKFLAVTPRLAKMNRCDPKMKKILRKTATRKTRNAAFDEDTPIGTFGTYKKEFDIPWSID